MNNPAITAVLIAPDTSGLRPVYRMPAIRRLIILLERLGISQIHIVGYTKALVPLLSDRLPAEAFHPADDAAALAHLLRNPALKKNATFLALRADMVIDGESLRRMVAEAGKGHPLFMPAKGESAADGLYLAGAADVVRILQTLWSPSSGPLPTADGCLVLQGPPGLPCRADGSAEGGILPETGLFGVLGRQTEADDGFMARHVDRRISRFFSRRLAHTAIRPNQITIVGMSIGLAGAFFLSLPGYWSQVFGALLFVFCVVVDGVDGEVARLKLMETPFGHTLDIVTDNIVHVAVFIGIAFGLYSHTGNSLYLRALLFLIGGFALAATAVYFCILRRGPGEIRQSSAGVRLMALLASRDFAYLILVLALLHRTGWFLLAAAAGSYLFTALLLSFRFLEVRPARERG